ncbi:MAG: hypothetical protein MJY55_00495 [Bacteroidales bacterium]|nr:hypothetical protein [Bacteroidales bacterium]
MKTSQISIEVLFLTAILPFATACRPQATSLQSSTLACTTSISLYCKGVASVAEYDSVDVFVYENDGTGRLDTYQKLPLNGPVLQIQSRAGNKTAVLVAGADNGFFDYNDILYLEGLGTVTRNLADEDPERPLRSAVINVTAGPSGEHSASLTPLLAEVTVRSLRTDFSARPYKDAVLENARAYLINVSGICPILWQGDFNPREIYNYGKEDSEGCRNLPHPEILRDDGVSGIPMYCYPCRGGNGGLGTCTTRLVIEGTIEGVTYYYPINVGNGTVEPGHRYIYDLTITRTGTLDPDVPAESSMIDVMMEAVPWEEYENEEILY